MTAVKREYNVTDVGYGRSTVRVYYKRACVDRWSAPQLDDHLDVFRAARS